MAVSRKAADQLVVARAHDVPHEIVDPDHSPVPIGAEDLVGQFVDGREACAAPPKLRFDAPTDSFPLASAARVGHRDDRTGPAVPSGATAVQRPV